MLSVLLSVCVIVSSITFADAIKNESDPIVGLADDIIQVHEDVSADGGLQTTYTCLDDFMAAVRERYPDMSDRDIAAFILEYTGRDSDEISDEQILRILGQDNVTVSTDYIIVYKDGRSCTLSEDLLPSASWNSVDGYMKLTTGYSYKKTGSGKNYYDVSATARWLKYPSAYLEDVFILGTNGMFDDSVSETGEIHQVFTCNICQHKTDMERSVDQYSQIDQDLELKYGSYVPLLKFVPYDYQCAQCGSYDTISSLYTVSVSYGIFAVGGANIQAGYAHKTFGISGIDVSVSPAGVPSFSTTLGTRMTPYVARAVTVP